MSRSNPNKKKHRVAKTTLLVYGEGMNEEVFLKYLRSLYAQDSDVQVTIKKGKGGTAEAIVIDANRTEGAFDRKVVVLDCDKSKKEMEQARIRAADLGIELIENSPCLEALLLSILLPGQLPQLKRSAEYKNRFERLFIIKSKRREVTEYKKVFPKALLETQRQKNKELDILITLMEGITPL